MNALLSGLLNQQWTAAEHPETVLEAAHFHYREVPAPSLQDGQALLRTHLLNIAPVMRMYMMRGSAANEAPLEKGFEKMPEALMGMFTATGGGKRYVKLVLGSVAVYESKRAIN